MLSVVALLLGLLSLPATAQPHAAVHVLSGAPTGDPWVGDILREIRLAHPDIQLHVDQNHHIAPNTDYWIATDAVAAKHLADIDSPHRWQLSAGEVEQRPTHELLVQSPNFKLLARALTQIMQPAGLWIAPENQDHPWFEQALAEFRKTGWQLTALPEQAKLQLLLQSHERPVVELVASPWRHHIGRGAHIGGTLDGQTIAQALIRMMDQTPPEVPRLLTLMGRTLWVDNLALADMGLDWQTAESLFTPLDWTHLRETDEFYRTAFLLGGAVSGIIIFGLMAQNARQRSAKARVDRLITTDRLTGLLNSDGFYAKADARLDTDRHRVHAFVVCQVDLGAHSAELISHQDQDRVIQQISDRILGNTRQTELIGRLGPNEFAYMVQGTQLDSLGPWLEKLCDSLRLPCFVGERQVNVGASLGAALWPDHAASASTVTEQARKACRFAANIGDVSWSLFNPNSEDPHERNRVMLEDLKQAMSEDTLSLVYQPIVQLCDQSIVGVECLLRWQHPTLGAISPPDIIAIARHGALIGALGEWILNQAAAQAVRWQRMGLPLKVNVNVTPEQFSDPRFVSQIQHLLFETGLDPQRLTLEITEDATVQNPGQAMHALERLHSIGVSSAIDDFGTGYSSLSRLKQFKLDALKIDRSFVMDLDEDNSDHAINRAIIQIAHTMGLTVVAEGIETLDQMMLLIEEGCEYGQGYLFSKPVEAQQIHALINRLPEAKLA